MSVIQIDVHDNEPSLHSILWSFSMTQICMWMGAAHTNFRWPLGNKFWQLLGSFYAVEDADILWQLAPKSWVPSCNINQLFNCYMLL